MGTHGVRREGGSRAVRAAASPTDSALYVQGVHLGTQVRGRPRPSMMEGTECRCVCCAAGVRSCDLVGERERVRDPVYWVV